MKAGFLGPLLLALAFLALGVLAGYFIWGNPFETAPGVQYEECAKKCDIEFPQPQMNDCDSSPSPLICNQALVRHLECLNRCARKIGKIPD